MPKVEWVDVLDRAMRSGDLGAHLDGVQGAFADAGRDGDALMAAVIRALLQAGEIETVMCMRAEWGGTRRTGGDDIRRADPARRLRPHS